VRFSDLPAWSYQTPTERNPMNTQKLRRKRVVIPTLAAVAVLGAGGLVWSSAASDELTGDERDRASAAALEAVGEGKVTGTETDDEEGAYEIEVTRPDGSQVDVHLDKDFQVLSQEADDEDGDDEDGDDEDADDGRDDDGDRDADDRVLSDQERAAAEQAALAEVDGTVTDAEASDDPGEAYEVEVVTADGVEWTVELDADFEVLDARADD
jgi:uncharacterized membrane protein YkoI